MPAIRVVALAKAKPGCEEELGSVLAALVPPTRAEAGCRRYEILRSRSDPAAFAAVEEWDDDAALDRHLASAHVQATFGRMASLLAGPPSIERYSLVA